MILDLHALGVHARRAPLPAQLHQRMVDGADGLGPIHRTALEHDLGPGVAHHRGKPRVVHHGGVIHHPEVVGDDMVHLYPANLDVHRLRHGPHRVILGLDAFNVPFVEVDLVGILQKDRQLLVVQPMDRHLSVGQKLLRFADPQLKLPLIALKEDQIIEAARDLVFTAQTLKLLDPVVFDLHAGLKLLLGEEAVLIGFPQSFQLLILPLEVAVIDDRTLELDDVGAVVGVEGTQNPTQAALNGVGPAMLAEKAELNRVDLQNRPVICPILVLDQAVLNTGEGNDFLHVPAFCLRLPGFGLTLHRLAALLRSAVLDLLTLCVRQSLGLETEILLLAKPGLLPFIGRRLSPDAAVPALQRFLLLTAGQDLLADLIRRVRIAKDPILPCPLIFALPFALLPLLSIPGRIPGQGFGKQYVHRRNHHISLSPSHKLGVLLEPLKPAAIAEEGQNMQEIDIVRLFVKPDQQQDCQENNADAEPQLSRQVGEQNKDKHRQSDDADQDVPEGHAPEQLNMDLGLARYQSLHRFTSLYVAEALSRCPVPGSVRIVPVIGDAGSGECSADAGRRCWRVCAGAGPERPLRDSGCSDYSGYSGYSGCSG